MKKIIIANFNMNQTVEESKMYFTKLLSKFENKDIQLVICPPFTSLSVAKFFIDGTDIKLGAQNVADEENGGQNGEISAKMLKSAGSEYVITGHFDRRTKFGESNSTINKKIKESLKQGLKCILCVGETANEKSSMKTNEVIKKQIETCLKGLYENELESIVVAYEPVWAIGTGKTATIKDIENGIKAIRKTIKDNYSEKASRDLTIIYGGSLNTLNVGKLLQAKELDGALFGGFSLDAEAFISLINKIK